MLKLKRQIRKKLCIPIYDAVVWVIAVDGVSKERKKWEHLFGPVPSESNYDALCSYSGGHTFALFFERKELTLKIMAHEVFHLTHRMLDWVSANFDSGHHEQGALLHGYLMEEVWKALNKKP